MKKQSYKLLLLGLLSFVCSFDASTLHAQAKKDLKDSIIGLSMIKGHASYNASLYDLNKRFGNVFAIGVGFTRKTKKNFVWGFHADFLSGGLVKENNMLDGLYTGDSFIIGNDGTLYDVRFMMRGFALNGRIGKIIPVFGPNKNSGILITTGLGLLQHKVRFEFERDALPQLTNEYKKGYDRLSNGLNIQKFIGYFHLSNRNLWNFFIGLEMNYALTEGRRSYQFDLMGPETKQRRDGLLGLRFGWIIPLYKKLPPDFYYF
jgi:hypothetical protein